MIISFLPELFWYMSIMMLFIIIFLIIFNVTILWKKQKTQWLLLYTMAIIDDRFVRTDKLKGNSSQTHITITLFTYYYCGSAVGRLFFAVRDSIKNIFVIYLTPFHLIYCTKTSSQQLVSCCFLSQMRYYFTVVRICVNINLTHLFVIVFQSL